MWPFNSPSRSQLFSVEKQQAFPEDQAEAHVLRGLVPVRPSLASSRRQTSTSHEIHSDLTSNCINIEILYILDVCMYSICFSIIYMVYEYVDNIWKFQSRPKALQIYEDREIPLAALMIPFHGYHCTSTWNLQKTRVSCTQVSPANLGSGKGRKVKSFPFRGQMKKWWCSVP